VEAEAFYAAPGAALLRSLCAFMTSARQCWRWHWPQRGGAFGGHQATDPPRRSRDRAKLYAQSKERNAIHASDSPENGAREVAFFFTERELVGTAAR
jgi:hypothetical protein